MKGSAMAAFYPRHGDFVSLQERLDPRGAFRNEWLQSRCSAPGFEWGRHPA